MLRNIGHVLQHQTVQTSTDKLPASAQLTQNHDQPGKLRIYVTPVKQNTTAVHSVTSLDF